MGNDGAVSEPQSHQGASGIQGPCLERRITVVGLAGLAAFQLAIAAGAPLGRASYGGAHPGVLPDHLRVVSGGATLLYCGLAVAVARQRTPAHVRRQVLTGITALMGVGAVANGMSPSGPERAIWTPTCSVLALSAWRARHNP